MKSKYSFHPFFKYQFFLFSVFDSVPIPYPKREFITEDDNSDTAGGAHVSKTEPAVVVKTESSSVILNQQQPSHVAHSQQQPNVHIKQQPQQQHINNNNNNIVQHAQQVSLKYIKEDCLYGLIRLN